MRRGFWLALLVPSAANAATLEVGPTRAYPNLTKAVSEAEDGDEIVIDGGTYAETLQIDDLAITLRAAGTDVVNITGGNSYAFRIRDSEVVLRGVAIANSRRAFQIEDSTVEITDVTVANTSSDANGGALFAKNSTVTLQNVAFTNTTTSASGGAIALEETDLTGTGVSINNPSGTSGAGIYAVDHSSLTLTDSEILSADASLIGGNGGGIYANDGTTLTLDGVTITGGGGGGNGGAIYLADGSAVFTDVSVSGYANQGGGLFLRASTAVSTRTTVTNAYALTSAGGLRLESTTSWDGVGDIFTGNRSSGYGGGVLLADSATAVFEGGVWTSNTGSRGGGLYLGTNNAVSVKDGVFTTNLSYARGGGIAYAPSSITTLLTVENTVFLRNEVDGNDTIGGAISLADGLASVTGSRFVTNDAVNGGAVSASAVKGLTLHGNWFCTNTANRGAAVYTSNTTVTAWTNNVFVENAARAYGGAAYLDTGVAPSLVNNTFLGNKATTQGGAVYFNNVAGTLMNNLLQGSTGNAVAADGQAGNRTYVFKYNDFFGNTAANFGQGLANTALDDTNLAVEPGLRLYSPNGNCDDDKPWPGYGSALIDAGDPSLLDPDASTSDIGAYGGPGADPALFADTDDDGYIAMLDCDDTDAQITEPTPWYPDVDDDGFAGAGTPVVACDAPAGYLATAEDCNDADARIFPGAAEQCDDVDRDCDGTTGNGDFDGDSFAACADCDDHADDVYPEADETCDGIDQNCNGIADDSPIDGDSWFADADGDGFGDAEVIACEQPGETSLRDGDCDDASADVYPGAPEACDGAVDQNCDGFLGNVDADGDGALACDDCNDDDADIHPGVDDLCDEIDNDCDGAVDEQAAEFGETTYADGDGDGFGDPTTAQTTCSSQPGRVLDNTDCDDAAPSVYPGAPEQVVDGVDQDCDGADLLETETLRPGAGGCGCDSSVTAAGTPWLVLGAAFFSLRRRKFSIL